jgi:SAM-dependent methyltransferase
MTPHDTISYVHGMTASEEMFQIPIEVAETYEAKFVPAIFGQWAPCVLDASSVGPGTRLLDVACGTGIVARTAVERVAPGGSVVGVDLNEAMLTVARRAAPEIDWRQGDVGSLPFPDATFDVAVCQMAMMFFADRRQAFAEMARVVAPGGAVAVLVPASLDVQPAYRVFVDVAARHAGPEARSLLGAYWNCGDLDELVAVAESAGLEVGDRRTTTGPARFESADDFVATEVEGSPLIERLDEGAYARIRAVTGEALSHYVTDAGRFEVPLLCHVLSARRPR